MTNIVPKKCQDMESDDVLQIPGTVEYAGPENFRARRAVLGLYEDDVGNLTLPDGSELTIPPDTVWEVHGVVHITSPPSGSQGGGDREAVWSTIRRIGSGTASVDDSDGFTSPFSISISGSDVVRFALDDGNTRNTILLLDILETDSQEAV